MAKEVPSIYKMEGASFFDCFIGQFKREHQNAAGEKFPAA